MRSRPNGAFLSSPGRPRGSRNRLTKDFIEALAKEFAEHGESAIRIVRVESPDVFLKLVASIIPKELAADLAEDEIDSMVEMLQSKLLEQSAPPMIEARPIEEAKSDERKD